jgi:hypothetical protein
MLRQHELGADTVGARDKYRLPVAIGWQCKQAAETADASKDFGALRALDERLDPLYKFIASINVDASIFVRKWFIAHFGVA